MTVALVLAFNLLAGFNDGGNLLATLLPSRVRPILLWLWLAVVVGLGPIVLGTQVADTIVRRIVTPATLAPILAPATLAALLVVLVSWWQRVPTSMSLALIGAMVGAGTTAGSHVIWAGATRALVGFILTVVLGGLLGLVIARYGRQLLRRLRRGAVLSLLLVVTALLEGIAYGGNDLEKAIGLLNFSGFSLHAAVLFAVLSFAVGSAVGSWRIARTVSSQILRLRPPEALYTQAATGIAVLAAAAAGIPVSTSQTVDAGLLGVGSAENPRHVGWRVARRMVSAWVFTPLAAFVIGGVAAWIAILLPRV
jgi:PiT family inorganic phosphate transporter